MPYSIFQTSYFSNSFMSYKQYNPVGYLNYSRCMRYILFDLFYSLNCSNIFYSSLLVVFNCWNHIESHRITPDCTKSSILVVQIVLIPSTHLFRLFEYFRYPRTSIAIVPDMSDGFIFVPDVSDGVAIIPTDSRSFRWIHDSFGGFRRLPVYS